jgi:hypothetical protein
MATEWEFLVINIYCCMDVWMMMVNLNKSEIFFNFRTENLTVDQIILSPFFASAIIFTTHFMRIFFMWFFKHTQNHHYFYFSINSEQNILKLFTTCSRMQIVENLCFSAKFTRNYDSEQQSREHTKNKNKFKVAKNIKENSRASDCENFHFFLRAN